MRFRKIERDKKRYIELLLLGDEQEEMIDRYLQRGDLWIMEDNGVKAVCVVTDEGEGVVEIKNIAVVPECQGQGYGHRMIVWIKRRYGDYSTLRVGTGEAPSTLRFYRSCGFETVGRIRDFFTTNYDHEIVEEGVVLRDMVVLELPLRKEMNRERRKERKYGNV